MTTHLVLTLIGRDRPGLVRTVASVVALHGGNWLESRLCRLGGEFAASCGSKSRQAAPTNCAPPWARWRVCGWT
ncbi:MAG: hypothetical protein EAZ36_04850 [Verrucomicrobia bacterium]|nr:MAG: hypothetical protein EAZ36_04850 [Verrucomicrobiota bacterium]